MEAQPRIRTDRLRSRQGHFIGAYIAGMLAAALVGAFFGNVVGFEVWLVTSSGLLLAQKALAYSRQQLWSKTFIYLFIPGVLWVLFGIGGLVALLFPDSQLDYGVQLEGISILLLTAYVLLGLLVYLLVVKILAGRLVTIRIPGVALGRFRLTTFTLGVLFFDWYVRLDQIRLGVYFTWLRRHAGLADVARTTNPLYHLQSSTTSLVLPLLVYLDSRANHKLFRILILGQLVFVFLNGKRLDLILAVFSLVAALAIINRQAINMRLLLVTVTLTLFFFGFIGPMIQVARMEMRADAQELQKNPTSIPRRFVTEYLPRAFLAASDSAEEERASSIGRIGSYMAFGASINQVLLNGDARPNTQGLVAALSLAIPRVLYPNKLTLDADAIVQQHFGLSGPADAAGSPVADVFSYMHVPGILLLLAGVGVVVGLMARLLLPYGVFGELMLLGLLLNLLTVGDAFGAYIATLRNVLLIVFALRIWIPTAQRRIRRSRYVYG